MRKIIHNLRKRPEEERRHILHIITFAAALILILLWVWSLGSDFSSEDTKVKVKQDLEPFNLLKDSITN